MKGSPMDEGPPPRCAQPPEPPAVLPAAAAPAANRTVARTKAASAPPLPTAEFFKRTAATVRFASASDRTAPPCWAALRKITTNQ